MDQFKSKKTCTNIFFPVQVFVKEKFKKAYKKENELVMKDNDCIVVDPGKGVCADPVNRRERDLVPQAGTKSVS